VPSRCDYVLGIAEEVEQVRGKPAAGKFLAEAGPWAEQIKEAPVRREALSAYAWKLFLFDDYDGGRDMLRHDNDAAWRTDMLVMMSRGVPVFELGSSMASSWKQSYGAKLDYKSNFKGQAAQPQK